MSEIQRFPPRRDKVYAFAIWLAPVITAALIIIAFSIPLLVIFILSLLLSFWLWNTTDYYILNDNEFLIRSCIFKKTIPINEIWSVRQVRNLYSSFALAVNRLEIKTINYETFYISPEDSDSFLNEIRKHNIMEG